MNTNNLKKFAKEARQILMQGVSRKLAWWGFDENGNVVEEMQSIKGGYIFREQPFDDADIPKKWQALKSAVQHHSVKDVIEEAAYTWFNRLIAIKILEQNNHISPQLAYLSHDLTDPQMLANARKGQIEYLKPKDKEKLNRYLQESDDEAVFALLLINYCQGHPLLKRVFGHIDDYTELLLPDNLLSNNGMIELLNTTKAVKQYDYKESELIGWLYQFYISDKKDEVFAGFKKNKKARAEDIPAATQIFTPKWIVKYLVENTVGRLWLDLHPDSPIKKQMKYLVEPSEENRKTSEPIINEVSELKVLDPAVGSGHFLLVAFDLLLEMYKEEGYTPKNAVGQILANNLFGLDICPRAVQLANFAVLLKAAQYDPDILTKEIKPKIYAMPEPRAFSRQDVYDFLGEDGLEFADELEKALKEMQQAQNIGSALIIDLSNAARKHITQRLKVLKEKQQQGQLDLAWQAFFSMIQEFIEPLLFLSAKFQAVVANPPYMGGKNMNAALSEYVKANYPMSKSDLFAVFMEVCISLSKNSGFMGMINQHSWMFLSSFEKLRKYFVENFTITSMLHLGPRVFDELSGEVVQSTSFVFRKEANKDYKGNYFRLVDYKSSDAKREKFEKREHHFNHLAQSNFEKIPGSPIAYWVSVQTIRIFNENLRISDYAESGGRIKTHNNQKYVRYFWEVNKNQISDKSKWKLYENGGDNLKWYGNKHFVVNWTDTALTEYKSKGGLTEEKYWNSIGITWSIISAGNYSFRYKENDCEYSSGSPTIFLNNQNNLFPILGYLNSNYVKYLLSIINPTVNTSVGEVLKLPFSKNLNSLVEKNVKQCIDIYKYYWDSREISYYFVNNILLNKTSSLVESYKNFIHNANNQFSLVYSLQIDINKEINRAYGIKNEVNDEIAFQDIKFLKDELDLNQIKKLDNYNKSFMDKQIKLPIKRNIIIGQLLSYVTGCSMGRYRLDKPGLNIAHPDPTPEELSSYTYNGRTFEIDDDAIIPFMGSDSPFSDDIVLRVKDFVLTIWGEETLTENLNFINDALGIDMEKFMVSKFWYFHKKMYKKRPIYWLFASPKKSFQVLVYMHRMNRFTVQKIRQNYLLKYLNYLNMEIKRLHEKEASISRVEAKRLDNLRKEEIECREYDLLLKDFADRQIEFDLDDGVVVNHAKFEGIVVKI